MRITACFHPQRLARTARGFTLAYPSYVNSITKTKRKAAEACLSSYATWMERFYTSNLRYDEDAAGNDVSLPTMDCATAQNTGNDYSYSFSGTPTRTTYTVQAVPRGAQATHDAACGTLTLDQTGQKDTSGDEGPATCW